MWNQPIALRQRKLFECKFVCFVVVVFSCCFFLEGGQGVGIGLLFWGGWNTTQRDVNAIHRTSECYSWQRKFDRRCLNFFFFFFVCLFFGFYFIFIIFRGGGGGGWLSLFGGGVQGIDYPNYAPSTVSPKILAQFRFGLFCFLLWFSLFSLFVFFKPLQYFGAPENIKKWTYHSVKPPDFCTMPLLYSGLQNSKTFSQPASTW